MIKMGKTYAEKSKLITNAVKTVFRGKVWRGRNKKYTANERDFWTFHPGMDSHIARYTVGQRAIYTSLKEGTTIREIMSNNTKLRTSEEVRQVYRISRPKYIEIDSVLDLTDPKVLKQLDILNSDDLIRDIIKNTGAYDLTQVTGHIARKRGFKGIIVPSAPDRANKGINFISFKEFE